MRGPVTPWLLLLAKSFATGKSRLAPVLDDSARTRLNEFLLRHALAVAHRFPGRERTAVISECARTLQLASAHGFRAIAQADVSGLNGAAAQGVAQLCSIGVQHVLVLACDMPAVRADDLRKVAAGAREREVVLCPDKAGTGTNGLLVPRDVPMQFHFGLHSLQKHCREVARLGLAPRIHRDPRIAFDVDTAADLQRWYRQYPDQAAQAGIAFLEEGALLCA